MADTQAVTGLSAMDLKALRQADDVCFHHDKTGNGLIRAVKRLQQRGPFDESERDWRLEVQSDCRCYGEDSHLREVPDRVAFAMAYGYGADWRTVAAMLRAGDILRLQWRGDVNGYTREHGLHIDRLTLLVRRPGRNGQAKEYAFRVADSVCPDNTARMIHRPIWS